MVIEETAVDVSQDWLRACAVQRRFMEGRCSWIDGLDCAARCRQVWEVGGDCFDFAPLDAGRAGISIGDASGKGFAAALMISSVQSSLRTAARFTAGAPAATLAAVNQQVHESSLADRYATFFYGVFDAETQTLCYVNAGHNPPMVQRRDGSVDWLNIGGAPLGLFSDSAYEEGYVRLRPGDLVIAYTDGVGGSSESARGRVGCRGSVRSGEEFPRSHRPCSSGCTLREVGQFFARVLGRRRDRGSASGELSGQRSVLIAPRMSLSPSSRVRCPPPPVVS